MNANNSFRTSITVLTAATIVGGVVILLSGFSQFQLRPATSGKAQVSTVNQKLRNWYGEFYPVETSVAATKTTPTSKNIIRGASQSSTSDEVVTTTSEYDNSEVVTSWSSSGSAGAPQVSVPVTINVNNGELMAQLIETRESLAEVKAQQSAIRQDQRVFSYQVHTGGTPFAMNTGVATATFAPTAAEATKPDSVSAHESTSNTARARVASHRNDLSTGIHHESPTADHDQSSEVYSSLTETAGRRASRIRSNSATGDAHQVMQTANKALFSSEKKSVSEPKQFTEARPAKTVSPTAEANSESGFETEKETSNAKKESAFSIEEEVSFKSLYYPEPPAAEVEDFGVAPVIEPISYNVEETIEDSSSISVTEESVVHFAPLDESTRLDESTIAYKVPAPLPELSIQEPQPEKSAETPILNVDKETTATESNKPRTVPATSDQPSGVPRIPDFFLTEEDLASEQQLAAGASSDESPRAEKSGRTREQLSTAFASVRGLPPENLFQDRSTPFVMPVEPADPESDESLPGFVVADSESKSGADARPSGNMSETAPPKILFGEFIGDSLVVHPSSAVSPVELEFGEPSAPNPALAYSENPGSPETPLMPPAEQEPERWHKYRSRVHQKQYNSPSTPVPPIPEIASTEVPEVPSSTFEEPASVPPALDYSLENSLVESDETNSISDQTISDSPLMIPDKDGTTEVAQKSDSEKLGSLSLPPIPELAPVPRLSPVPEMQLPLDAAQANDSLVYEPQPVMDRLNEARADMNSAPVFSSSPSMLAERRMPTKSAKKLPFETTFRRINKRVAWMADAMSSPEKKAAQQKPTEPKAPELEQPQYGPHPPTQRHGLAAEKKNTLFPPLLLPKVTVPKFKVQQFALPNVNFRAIQAPELHIPMLDTPDWVACPPDIMAPVRNSTAIHRVISTMQFAGQPTALK